MNNRCYILSAAQVSCQKPLSDEWMTAPVTYTDTYVRAQEPDSKEFIPPSEARRMSKILKRTICTAITAINNSGIDEPDAIITGTGMGCMENSEKFLVDLCNFGENCLKPTLFMQSTHNTISSLIAIVLKNHGYNNTYSHKGLSFDSALLDAWLQIKSGAISSALVGAHDEVTPFMSLVFNNVHPDYAFVSETSVSTVLSAHADGKKPLCEVESVELLYKPSPQQLVEACRLTDKSLLLTGLNGNQLNDEPYQHIFDVMPSDPGVLKFKHIFGENFASSAMATYIAAKIIETQTIPDFLKHSGDFTGINEIDDITVINHSDGTSWSVVKLRKV